MLLAIDIGNTHIVFGVFESDIITHSWRLRTESDETVDEFALQLLALLKTAALSSRDISSVVASCVVPKLTRVVAKVGVKYFGCEPIIVGPGVKTGMTVRVDDPRSVGADRIVNAVAARENFGSPLIVVDFGTATTFDVVNREGEYIGGVIAPGMMIASQALYERAAQLPVIEIRRPTDVIGKNTQSAMLSGIYFGYASLVDGMLERISAELGYEPNVIATGGLSRILVEESKLIDEVAPELTLQGLQIIAALNT